MRNPYYENTDMKNRMNNGEDVFKTAEDSPLRCTFNHMVNGDTKSVYHFGFGLGVYFCVLKRLYPELKLYGCEFDPMFFNFGEAVLNINKCVESVHLYNSFDSYKLSGSYDIVIVEAWVNSLDRDTKYETFQKLVGMAKQCVVFEKLDLDFEYDKGLYEIKEQENGTVVAKMLPFDIVWGPELKFTETESVTLDSAKRYNPTDIYVSKEAMEDIKNWSDLGEHPPIKGENDE